MPVLAIPNISVGTPGETLDAAVSAVTTAAARLLDVHSDEVHNRSVLTCTGDEDSLVEAMTALALACRAIDLSHHRGVHPRVGALDICPFVGQATELDDAIGLAHRTGQAIADATGAPVFFYGAAALRPENVELPALRRGGLEGLSERMAMGMAPDAGSSRIDPRYGAVLVGARSTLIAFNVWLTCELGVAQALAARVRQPHRVRALGLGMGPGRCQVSMNLVAPGEVGIDEAFARVERHAANSGAEIVATEIVGLVPERYLPGPGAKAARLLIEPGRSLESVLGG